MIYSSFHGNTNLLSFILTNPHCCSFLFILFLDLTRFGVNPDTGAFSSKAALQGLSIRSPIHFKVTARDQGTPPKFGVTYVEVNITSGQLDDGLPVWTRPAPGTTIDVMEASYYFWITKGDNLNIPKIMSSPKQANRFIVIFYTKRHAKWNI